MANTAEEVKELPPIVMISEEAFVTQHLNPAFEAIATALAADVKVFDKAQTKKLMQDTINREEIKDDVFEPWFLQMPKPKGEEDKEPLLFEDAKECVLRYAVSIKMIPSRLKTALDLYNDALTQPERQIYDFFGNESLSDVVLIHPTSGATYK